MEGGGLWAWLTPARVRRYLLAVACTLVVCAIAYSAPTLRRFPLDRLGTPVLFDFMAHYTGGRLLLLGRLDELYDMRVQTELQRAITGSDSVDLFISPPLVTVLYAPFALLAVAARRLGELTAPCDAGTRLDLALACLATLPLYVLLLAGQDSAVTLAIWTSGIALSLRRRDVAAGLLFSLGAFKPQLFLGVPLLLLILDRRRALGAWAAGTAVQIVATLAFFGPARVAAWIGMITSDDYRSGVLAAYAYRMASLGPFLVSFFPPSAARLASGLGVVASLALYAFAARVLLAERRRGVLDERRAWALASLVTFLAAPHFLNYDLVLLVIPVALVLAITPVLSRTLRNVFLALVVLSYTDLARHAAQELPYPLRVLGACWLVVPMLVLVRELARPAGG